MVAYRVVRVCVCVSFRIRRVSATAHNEVRRVVERSEDEQRTPPAADVAARWSSVFGRGEADEGRVQSGAATWGRVRGVFQACFVGARSGN